MSRTWAVVKREFSESVRSRMFIIGTLFGPLFFVGLLGFEALMLRSTGGEKTVVVVDATGAGVGARIAEALRPPPDAAAQSDRTRFNIELTEPDARDSSALEQELAARIDGKEIDGVVWLPANLLDGGAATYEGRSATNIGVVAQLGSAVQRAVQSVRLASQGIDPQRLALALRSVPFQARKAASGAAQGSTEALFVLGYVLGMVVYMVVLIFGMAVMRGVLEEKKDRIVEVVVSSIRARQLMLGKVLGIGGASVLQVAVWAGLAAIALRYGASILAGFGVSGVHMPEVPGSVGAVFLLFFAGGFFLYASIYAALGAVAASDQDMQQLQLPPTLVMIFSLFVMFRAMTDPEGAVARVSSWVPFSSPLVMPVRTALTDVPLWEQAGSLLTLVLTGLLTIWIGGKVYRVAILATGKRPSLAELVRWVRAA